MWKGRTSMPCLSLPLSQHLHMFIHSGSSSNPTLLSFTEASLHRCNWLNHWSLVIKLSLRPLFPSLELQGNGNGGSNALITQLVILSTGPQSSSVFPKSHLVQHNKRHLHCSYHLGNSKGFRSSMSHIGGQRWNISIYLL